MLLFPTVTRWAAHLAFATVLAQMMGCSASASPHLNADLPAGSLVARGKAAPNAQCSVDSDCASGQCYTPTFACDRLFPNGSLLDCYNYEDGSYGASYCQGYPLGHKCANQGECRNGRCNKKKFCVKTTVGEACLTDLGCSGSQVCRSGKCFAPAANSLEPNEICKVNASCKSLDCTESLTNQISAYGPRAIIVLPTKCNYFALGQKGCRDFNDCQEGLCQNGVCQLGKDGDRCLANIQCENLCGLDGVCFTRDPNHPAGQGAPCKTDEQCAGHQCLAPNGNFPITRPDFSNPGKNFTYLDDGNCVGGMFGDKCVVSDDCAVGYCVKGICKGSPLNSTCTEDKGCTSVTCIKANGATKGKCGIAKYLAPCSSNSTCYSNSCAASQCYYYQTLCPQPHCQPVPEGDKCRFDSDCDSLNYLCTGGTCTYKYGPGK